MSATGQPNCCPICGSYLTTTAAYAGNRCTDPGHWQASGLLAPRDFYTMAQLAALAHQERAYRPEPWQEENETG